MGIVYSGKGDRIAINSLVIGEEAARGGKNREEGYSPFERFTGKKKGCTNFKSHPKDSLQDPFQPR